MAVEHALEKAMIEWLNKSGHYAVAVKSGMIEQLRYGYHSWVHLAPKGTPDIFACIKGKFVGIETKAGKGKPTALQEKNLMNIMGTGGIAVLVNEGGIGALALFLKAELPEQGMFLDLLKER